MKKRKLDPETFLDSPRSAADLIREINQIMTEFETLYARLIRSMKIREAMEVRAEQRAWVVTYTRLIEAPGFRQTPNLAPKDAGRAQILVDLRDSQGVRGTPTLTPSLALPMPQPFLAQMPGESCSALEPGAAPPETHTVESPALEYQEDTSQALAYLEHLRSGGNEQEPRG